MMSFMWIVTLVGEQPPMDIFPAGYFPRPVHYKMAAQELIRVIVSLGGQAEMKWQAVQA